MVATVPTPIGFRFHGGQWLPDYMPDDYVDKEGLSIITGCSHAGIRNIIARTKRVTGETRVHSVLGGVHLKEPASEQLRHTVDFFAESS